MAIVNRADHLVRRLAGRLAPSSWLALAFVATLHLVGFAILYRTEWGLLHGTLAGLTWGFINFLWLFLLRRPGISAAFSLAMVTLLIVISQFKFDILWMGVSFFDFLIIDPDTVAFLVGVFPQLRTVAIVAAIVGVPTLILIWRLDPLRIPRLQSLGAATACVAALVALSVAVPEEPWEPFQGVNHLSNFSRSGVIEASGYLTHGLLDADAHAADRLNMTANATCHPTSKPPHIIMVLDESSFDITDAPGIKVPPDYRDHFRSFDGRQRSLLVEGSGGPTWYTEYNALTGLSARSFGRFKFYVTRIAAGRVERGLPRSLARCGYKTVTLYPTSGEFLGARRFQTTAGIERFIDQNDMNAADDQQPDSYYYDQALNMIAREKGDRPLFILVYLAANHFPWTSTFRADMTPDWQSLGNDDPAVDEYIRRQTMSARDYRDFLARLGRDFPCEPFLLVRFGDHQPALSAKILDPSLDEEAIARRIMAFDARYFTTYYAIDAVNFRPVNLSSALTRLEAPHLPLVVQEAAGLPLGPTFVEQKKILERCWGAFYACANGAEARRFNRLLIDAGLIKHL